MNGPRFNHFFIYVFDLNNLKSQGLVRTLANPLSKKRLEAIFTETIENLGTICPSEGLEDCTTNADDVTTVEYYDDDGDKETCSCSRKAKCLTNKCSCFKNNTKCKPYCHPEMSSNCTNKN